MLRILIVIGLIMVMCRCLNGKGLINGLDQSGF